MKKTLFLLLMLFCMHTSILMAGEADVLNVSVQRSGDSYRFDVTVLHQDAGWKHYADKWDVVSDNGTVLATRVLYHPHVNEQPFTRSLSGVEIPEGVKSVTIRAHDSMHEYGGNTVAVEIK
jgi:hypothetical protein